MGEWEEIYNIICVCINAEGAILHSTPSHDSIPALPFPLTYPTHLTALPHPVSCACLPARHAIPTSKHACAFLHCLGRFLPFCLHCTPHFGHSDHLSVVAVSDSGRHLFSTQLFLLLHTYLPTVSCSPSLLRQ